VTRDDFRRQADLVREIPLEVVLSSWGAVRDRRDRSQWQTPRGPLSVTGTQFFNWHACQGGGGAIDLAMHLGGWQARQAIAWLWRHLGGYVAGANSTGDATPDAAAAWNKASTFRDAASSARSTPRLYPNEGNPASGPPHLPLHLPAASLANLSRVRRYLTQQRGLSATILAALIDEAKLYADARGNAVFVMVAGKPNHPIGAELRGTGNRVWHGLAPGSRRNDGYFWIGRTDSKQIVLCESAIDAISCFQLQPGLLAPQLHGQCICISTAGVRPDAPWLYPLLARGYEIYCGFDADEPGETASRQMITRHPSIQRLRPSKHDWNDVLTAPSK
jgi:hypothetical protein